ncbi:MAG: hypothetical protein ACE5G5_11385 [Candidatus Methylomirabilales bacterium]
MTRRTLSTLLIGVVMLLSLGEAYHYHPDEGERWQLVAFPFAPSSSATDTSDSDSKTTSNTPTTCLLHFWSSLLSATSFIFPFALVPPASQTNLCQRTPHSTPSWTGLLLSIRGPPSILS